MQNENTKDESLLWYRHQHDSVRGAFDFETKNINGVPLVVAWGIAFYARNYENKSHNPLFQNELITQLISKKAINIEKITKWYTNQKKQKQKYKAILITGVNIYHFFQLLQNCLKNIRLVGQYNASFDNSFIFELGQTMAFFNHHEHLSEKEIILESKAQYLSHLKNNHNPNIKEKIEVLKNNGKYYRMVWLNSNNKKIIFDDDWLINGYDLVTKGAILGLAKQDHDDFENIPVFQNALELKASTKWYNYLIHDVIIIHIYSEIMLQAWSEKNEGYNNVKLTKSSNAFFYHIQTFTNAIITKMINEKIISKPYRRKVWPNNPKATKTIKVCDIINHKLLIEKYHLSSKKDYINYNHMQKAIWQNYFSTKWLSENENYIAQDLYDWKIGGMVHLNETIFKNDNSYLACLDEQKSQFKIAKIDINSSYPSVMCSNTFLCPYGSPLKCNKLNLKKYQLMKLIPKYNIKKHQTFMPLFMYRVAGKNKWVHSLQKGHEYYIDTNMWRYFNTHYNIKNFNIEYCYTFKAKSMASFFAETINQEYKNKSQWKNINEALYQQAKIILNSIFGKFVTKWRKTASYYDTKKQKWVTYDYYISGEYMPIGIAILNGARIKLCETVNDKYQAFKYCDTDSLCLLIPSDITNYKKYFREEWNLQLHPTELGAWDLEGIYIMWGFFQPKAYLVANCYNRLTNDGECIRKRAGYKFAEYNPNNNSLPMINTWQWKRHCTKKNIQAMIWAFIDGCDVNNQTARKYLPFHGVMLTTVVKEIKPIYNSYLQMSRKDYLAKNVIL